MSTSKALMFILPCLVVVSSPSTADSPCDLVPVFSIEKICSDYVRLRREIVSLELDEGSGRSFPDLRARSQALEESFGAFLKQCRDLKGSVELFRIRAKRVLGAQSADMLADTLLEEVDLLASERALSALDRTALAYWTEIQNLTGIRLGRPAELAEVLRPYCRLLGSSAVASYVDAILSRVGWGIERNIAKNLLKQ